MKLLTLALLLKPQRNRHRNSCSKSIPRCDIMVSLAPLLAAAAAAAAAAAPADLSLPLFPPSNITNDAQLQSEHHVLGGSKSQEQPAAAYKFFLRLKGIQSHSLGVVWRGGGYHVQLNSSLGRGTPSNPR